MKYYLGTDVGSTKTHAAIADETGKLVGFGESGPGNYESVGFKGMYTAMRQALEQALHAANITPSQISAAGHGVAGYDWPSEYPSCAAVIEGLGLPGPFTLVNDAILGLVAGSQEGWGVSVVSGTGCNCRGWDASRKREGRVTGHGVHLGEGAGASELVFKAMQYVGYSWAKRLPPTLLSDIFIKHVGAASLEDLIEGYARERYTLSASLAPEIFNAAHQSDRVAQSLATWAGQELGLLAVGVIRQLEFEPLEFDVVLSGSMFNAGKILIGPMHQTIQACAPLARLVRLETAPVIGAVLLAFEAAEDGPSAAVRDRLRRGSQ